MRERGRRDRRDPERGDHEAAGIRHVTGVSALRSKSIRASFGLYRLAVPARIPVARLDGPACA